MKIEIRRDSVKIEGYVNVTQRDSRTLNDEKRGKFIEQILPKAFDQALQRATNVDLLFNHKQDRKLGSTSQGTLELFEDVVGLRAVATVTDEEVIQSAREGRLKGWSFGFYAKDTDWTDSIPNRRYVKDLDLVEVSILDVTPAYYGTTIESRDGSDDLEIRTTEVDEMKELEERKNDLLDEIEAINEKLKLDTRGVDQMTVIHSPQLEAVQAEERAFVELVRRGETRDLAVANNGVLIPKSIATKIVDKVYEISPIVREATKYEVSGDLVLSAYDHNAHTTGFITEFTAITEAQGTFTGVTLTNKVIGTLSKIGKSLVNRVDVDVIPFIVNACAKSVAKFLEEQIVKNAAPTFTSNLKSGVSQSKTTGVTLKISPAELIALKNTIPTEFLPNAKWLMHKDTLTYLQSLTVGASDATLLFGNDLSQSSGNMLLGHEVMVSDAMDVIGVGKRQIYFGDFTEGVAIKMCNQSAEVYKELYAKEYAIGVGVFMEVDVSCSHSVQAIAVQIGL